METIFPYYVWRAKQDRFHFDSISQERNPTFSFCGGYFKITAKGDGTLEYEAKGEIFKTEGHATGTLSEKQLEELSGLILATGYLSLPENRPKNGTICASDSTIITTQVVAEYRKHSIRNECYINRDLQFFENKFLEIVDANRWFGSPQEQVELEKACISKFQ